MRQKSWLSGSIGTWLITAIAGITTLCFRPAQSDLKSSSVISPPFDKHDHRGSRIIPFWDKTGSSSIMQQFIRFHSDPTPVFVAEVGFGRPISDVSKMTPDKPDQTGTLWTRSAIGVSEFSFEWKFRISGSEATQYGDTLMLVVSDSKYKAGRFFGFKDDFVGIAIILNTNRHLISYGRPGEPTGRHRDVTVVANNGTRVYEDLLTNLEGCNANVRFDERREDFNVLQATRVRLKVSGSTLSLEVDARNSGRWRRCTTLPHLDMPNDWANRCTVGMVAKTSKATNNHDMLGFRLYTEPQEAWEADSYAEDEGDELDTLVHHMEHELFTVHDSLQDTIEQLKEAELEAEKRLSDLEATLSRNVMSALEERVSKLEVQVQSSVSRTVHKQVSQVYDRLEEDVGGKLSKQLGQVSGGWRWPFYGLLIIVCTIAALSFAKYRELKKEHLL